jgi:hypothetical protein
MLDTPRLLMIVGGLGLAVIGIRRKDRLEIGLGLCFIGSALAGQLAASNEVYAWIQLLFVIGMAVLLVAKYRALKKKNRDGGAQ